MIKDLFTKNVLLKILAFIGAFILWVVVVIIEDPEMTSTFTVSVNITNEDYLTDNGMVYQVLDSTDTIKLSVTAKRSVIRELSASDFKAIADLSNVNLSSGESVQKIDIDVSSARYSNQISLSAKTYFLKIELEDKNSAGIPVNVVVNGDTADGYSVGEITVLPKTIHIDGPDSVVSTIKAAVVTVDVSGITEDTEYRLTPVFVDADGNVVDSSRIITEIDEVTAYVECLTVKSVPVEYSTVGDTGEGAKIDSVNGSISSVMVKGRSEVLSELNYIRVSDLDVSGITEDREFSVSISKYLPDGVSLYGDETGEATVTVKVGLQTIKDFTFNTTDIKVEGLAENQTVTFTDTAVIIKAVGEESQLNSLENSDFTVVLDLTGVGEGSYTGVLNITAPSGVTIAEAVSAPVTIKGNTDSSSAEENNDNTSNNNTGTNTGNTDTTSDN